MRSESKKDFKAIKDAINFLSRNDRRNPGMRVGDNPKAVEATLEMIERLCSVIRSQEMAKGIDTVCR